MSRCSIDLFSQKYPDFEQEVQQSPHLLRLVGKFLRLALQVLGCSLQERKNTVCQAKVLVNTRDLFMPSAACNHVAQQAGLPISKVSSTSYALLNACHLSYISMQGRT
jgi:hypothetical protein